MTFLDFSEFIRGVKKLLEGEYGVILKTLKLHLDYKFVIGLILNQIWFRIAVGLLEVNFEAGKRLKLDS